MPLLLKPSAFHDCFFTRSTIIFSFSQKNFWKAFLETHSYCSYWIIFTFVVLGCSKHVRDDFSLWKQSSLNFSYVCMFINPLWKQDWLLVAPGSPQPFKQISCSLGIWAGLSQIPRWNKQCRLLLQPLQLQGPSNIYQSVCTVLLMSSFSWMWGADEHSQLFHVQQQQPHVPGVLE